MPDDDSTELTGEHTQKPRTVSDRVSAPDLSSGQQAGEQASAIQEEQATAETGSEVPNVKEAALETNGTESDNSAKLTDSHYRAGGGASDDERKPPTTVEPEKESASYSDSEDDRKPTAKESDDSSSSSDDSHDDETGDQISDYEKLRLERIKRNRE